MGELGRAMRLLRLWGLWILAVGLAMGAGPPTAALGAETHVFDPVLSLTGGCTTSSEDLVADPDCPEGALPADSFFTPTSVATDSYGNMFIANFGQASSGEEGRIGIFNSKGQFITEKAVPGPQSIAVDSAGNLYVNVINSIYTEQYRYPPSVYEPATGNIEYGKPPVLFGAKQFGLFHGIAVNPVNQHVFVNYSNRIGEYGSAAEENKVIDGSIGEGTISESPGIGLAIDATRGRIYSEDLTHSGPFPHPAVVRIFELESPHVLVGTIDGSTTPDEKFSTNRLSLAVDEATGHLFVYDGEGKNVVYEFTEDGKHVSTIAHNFKYTLGTEIAVDNGEHSPNGALNAFGRYLFVPSVPTGVGHSFAFSPIIECPPKVESLSFSEVTETEALLEAEIEPCNLKTTYTFEYTTIQSFEEEGFAGASVAGEGQIPAQLSPVKASAEAVGLAPGTAYRFRVMATNNLGSNEEVGEFATYPEPESGSCPNQALRTGQSALLPDCRAYELVTPPDTNARTPEGVDHLGTFFATRETSPSGDKVSFQIEGGSIPSQGGTGSLAGDPYLASRGEEGWETSYVGPTGAESPAVLPGSHSPDQGYSLWSTAGARGSASVEGSTTNYVRYPDGHSALVGRGSIASDPRAAGRLISEGGDHIIFDTGTAFPAVQLEENAPPDGTKTVYDRTADEVTHVVSLLPGNVTPAAGEDALCQGTSLDGRGVAFSIGKVLYLRYNDEETYEVGENVTFAGIAEGGARIFYVKGGDLFALDVEGEETIRFTESGDVTVVNVSADGSVAYFVSPSVLTGEEENPSEETAQVGKENLYLSREGQIRFVATVTESDVEGEVVGLGLWTAAVGSATGPPGRFGLDTSRTTPDGGILLFESQAPLTSYDSEGHTEVYRYDSVEGSLQCLSCNPTLGSATGEASLQSVAQNLSSPEPSSAYALMANLRADGRRAFFESTEPLVVGDTDGLLDVYEWEAEGVGSCKRPEGCVYLISSGHSKRIDYLFAVSASGNNVFFRTGDLLLKADHDETPSIYDARVEGGFPETETTSCQGEACRPTLTPPPLFPAPESGVHNPGGNVHEPKPCPKGKRRVKRDGKFHCVKKHYKHRHRRAGSGRKGPSK